MQQKKKKNKKGKGNYDVLYGAHAICEMLKAKKRKLASLYTTKPLPKAWQRIKPYLPKFIPNTQYVDRNVLSSMAKSNEHMGIVALVTPFPLAKKMFSPTTHPFILLLDGVQDVGNLGAILRSAYCTGVKGVVLTTKASAPLSAAVFKASAGLAEHLDIFPAPSVSAAVNEIKRAGYTLYMTVIKDGENAADVEYSKPMCLVIGSEATGIHKEVLSKGTRVTLPQVKPDISYNASVAAGIFLFLMSQRSK